MKHYKCRLAYIGLKVWNSSKNDAREYIFVMALFGSPRFTVGIEWNQDRHLIQNICISRTAIHNICISEINAVLDSILTVDGASKEMAMLNKKRSLIETTSMIDFEALIARKL